MNKLFSFLMVGLAFTALQVATVSADDGQVQDFTKQGDDPSDQHHDGGGDDHPDCPVGTTCGSKAGGPGEHHDGPPGMKGEHHDGPPGMKGEHHDGPPGMRGEHHDGPPMDPRSGQPFTQADEVKFQKYADECEATKGLLSEGSTQELVKEGFTRLQVEKLCKDGPEHAPAPGTAGGMR
jgi:hypothetical protein